MWASVVANKVASDVTGTAEPVVPIPLVLQRIDEAIIYVAAFVAAGIVAAAICRAVRGKRATLPLRPSTLAEDALIQVLLVYFLALLIVGFAFQLVGADLQSPVALVAVGAMGPLAGIGAWFVGFGAAVRGGGGGGGVACVGSCSGIRSWGGGEAVPTLPCRWCSRLVSARLCSN